YDLSHILFKVQDILNQADNLYGTGETEKLYKFLAEHKNSDNGDMLWRLARAAHDYSHLNTTPDNEKKRLIYEAVEFAKKALDKNPSGFAAHKWYAISLSDIGDYEGIQTKIANAFEVQKHFAKAIELNDKDAASFHLLGLWSYFIAELPLAQRQIASMLFATPPTATFEEALKLFERAEEVSPNLYSKNLLFLGKTFMKLQNKEKAIMWFLKAKQFTARTEEDKQVDIKLFNQEQHTVRTMLLYLKKVEDPCMLEDLVINWKEFQLKLSSILMKAPVGALLEQNQSGGKKRDALNIRNPGAQLVVPQGCSYPSMAVLILDPVQERRGSAFRDSNDKVSG
ncbi:regulator of microtubule dynamics protein 1-like, partial [Pleurodeles waltl]|uniref:regulator of microtubule dynamics protein 1-like n=1 Tax=Pleurodeles waltl TaxID=8319 RepID=UPI003709BE55